LISVFLSERFIRFCFTAVTLAVASFGANAQDLPWHLGSLNSAAPAAPSSINTAHVKPGPNEVVVAVIDSGVLSAHPSLEGRLLPGYDMLSAPLNLRGGRSADYAPDSRDAKCGDRVTSGSFRTHGTEVASLIAGNGQEGVRGVNPNAKILPIRLFSACPIARADLLDAMAWAGGLPVAGVPANPNPARVINLSFSGGKRICGPDLQQLIDRLAKKNIFVVAAVGNTFGKKLAEPANCEGVISVGAVDAENNIENYSALDPRTMIYAPGGGKDLTGNAPWRNNKLKVASVDVNFFGEESLLGADRGVGTSYAAPLVSGFVSLLLSHRIDMSPSEFISQLSKFSRPVNPTDKCSDCAPKGLAMLPNVYR
jgi:serine protease